MALLSYRVIQMAEPEDHKHCVICGRVVPPDKFVCSSECEDVLKEHQNQLMRRRKLNMILLVLLFVVFVVLVVTSLIT